MNQYTTECDNTQKPMLNRMEKYYVSLITETAKSLNKGQLPLNCGEIVEKISPTSKNKRELTQNAIRNLNFIFYQARDLTKYLFFLVCVLFILVILNIIRLINKKNLIKYKNLGNNRPKTINKVLITIMETVALSGFLHFLFILYYVVFEIGFRNL